MKRIILFYWGKHVNQDAVIMATMFSFDQESLENFSSSDITKAKKWFINHFAVEYLIHYSTITRLSQDKQYLTKRLSQQLLKFRGKDDEFSDFDDQMELLDKKTKLIWYNYLDTCPELSYSALALLSVSASEAAVERSFSCQDSIHSKKRNRLLDDTIESQIFIKFIHHALKRSGFAAKIKEIDLFSPSDSECVTNSEDYQTAKLFVDLKDDFDDVLSEEQQFDFDQFSVSSESNYLLSNINSQSHCQTQSEEKKDNLESNIIIQQENEIQLFYSAEQERMKEEKEQNTLLFLKSFIKTNQITLSYRWTSDKENNLTSAQSNHHPTISDTITVLKQKIKSILNQQQLQNITQEAIATLGELSSNHPIL